MKRKNVVVYSLFPETAPDKVEVWQQGGVGQKIKKMRDRSKYKRYSGGAVEGLNQHGAAQLRRLAR